LFDVKTALFALQALALLAGLESWSIGGIVVSKNYS
jgi:hypothetical protein